MPEEKVKKLDRLLSLLDPENALTKSDFVESFKKAVDLILKIQARQEQAIQQLFVEHSRLAGERKQEFTSNLQEIKGQVNDLFVGNRLKEMETKTTGEFAELKRLVNNLVSQKISEVDHGLSKFRQTSDERESSLGKLTTLAEKAISDGSGKIDGAILKLKDLKEIKELREEIETLKRIKSQRPMGRAKVPMPRTIDLTSDQNGIARVFNIPPDTVRIFGGLSSQFPFAISSADIDRAGNQITLDDTIAPRERGQTLLIFTDALFYP